MNKKISELRHYLKQLETDTGWQIIIEDFYGILRSYEVISEYLSDRNWHTNPYCMEIKKNGKLWRRCVALKRATRRNIRKRGTPGFNVCYCGVAEYTVPIIIGGVHIATISAAGFYSPLKKRTAIVLANRTGNSEENLEKIRKENLRETNESVENKLKIYLKVAADIIEEAAMGSPLVKLKENRIDEQQRYVLMAIDHIEKHLTEDITPKSVAKRCHISLSYLQHLFLRLHGEGIATVIRRKRLERACELLVGTNRSIRDISLSCGFYDTDYFSVIFRRVYGITPLKFRRQHRIDF